VPFGCQLLQQLAAGRRKDKSVIHVFDKDAAATVPATVARQKNDEGDVIFTVGLKAPKFRFLDSRGVAYLGDNSPCSALQDLGNSTEPLVGVAAQRLDLAGGASRAENVTFLPRGCFFAHKCFLVMGRPLPSELAENVPKASKAVRILLNKASDFGKLFVDADNSLLALEEDKIQELYDLFAGQFSHRTATLGVDFTKELDAKQYYYDEDDFHGIKDVDNYFFEGGDEGNYDENIVYDAK
jgi:hypothetical protein